MKAHSALRASMLSVSLLALTPSIAYAQTAPADEDEATSEDEDVIVVTGTSASRNTQNTPLSIALVDEADLRTFTGSGSQADTLATNSWPKN